MPPSALPLKVTSTPAKGMAPDVTPETTPTPSVKQANGPKPRIAAKDISSPHELTAFVESLLEQLDAKFDDMSTQILDRMTQMSSRVDALEASIQDIINGDVTGTVSVPQSPPPTGTLRRSDSGLP